MTAALTANGYDTDYDPTDVFYDDFTRADAAELGNGWLDLADTYPTMFNKLTIVDNAAVHTPVTPRVGTGTPNVGAACVYQDFGLTDNFEVGIRWDCATDPVLFAVGQPSPSAWVDAAAVDVTKMGLSCPRTDIGLDRMYPGNVFRNLLSWAYEYENPPPGSNDFINYDHALAVANGNPNPWTFNGGKDAGARWPDHWFTMRCVAGSITGYQDGIRLLGPFAKPAGYPTTGNLGINIITSDLAGALPVRIRGFYVRDLS